MKYGGELNLTWSLRKKLSDAEGIFFILDIEITSENIVFINLYNQNTESTQIKTFEILFSHITLLHLDERSQIVSVGDFNLFFNYQLEADGGNPSFKSKSVCKFYEISETLDLCDIWRVRNRAKKKIRFPSKTLFWLYSKNTRPYFYLK